MKNIPGRGWATEIRNSVRRRWLEWDSVRGATARTWNRVTGCAWTWSAAVWPGRRRTWMRRGPDTTRPSTGWCLPSTTASRRCVWRTCLDPCTRGYPKPSCTQWTTLPTYKTTWVGFTLIHNMDLTQWVSNSARDSFKWVMVYLFLIYYTIYL